MYNKYSHQYNHWCQFYDENSEEMRIIHRYLNFENTDVLEVGCGTGRFTQKILADNPLSIIAIDNDKESIKIAKSNCSDGKVRFIPLDANELDHHYSSQLFDYVVFSWSINYILDYYRVLESALSCCKKNGKIVILFPCASEYSNLIKSIKNDGSDNCFSKELYESIKNFFIDNNLNIYEDEIITNFTYPSEKEAYESNLFHWKAVDIPLTEKETTVFRKKLKKYEKNEKICIQDKVKLLIGGK